MRASRRERRAQHVPNPDRFAERADIWTYDTPADPPPDLDARAAARRRSAQIRAEVKRYLERMGR